MSDKNLVQFMVRLRAHQGERQNFYQYSFGFQRMIELGARVLMKIEPCHDEDILIMEATAEAISEMKEDTHIRYVAKFPE